MKTFTVKGFLGFLTYIVNICVIESHNILFWKRSLGSSSSHVNPALSNPPVNHVPLPHIHVYFLTFPEMMTPPHPEQPISMLEIRPPSVYEEWDIRFVLVGWRVGSSACHKIGVVCYTHTVGCSLALTRVIPRTWFSSTDHLLPKPHLRCSRPSIINTLKRVCKHQGCQLISA